MNSHPSHAENDRSAERGSASVQSGTARPGRPWRPGHPLAPRLSRLRRWGVLTLLALFTCIIGGYAYITDSQRVEQMAEAYLSEVLGGRVEVGGATLSIFQGLRLDDVKVLVDDGQTLDSVIFSARTFLIGYDPSAIIRGRLEATEISAIEPRIHLVENHDTGMRNYQRLHREPRPQTERPERRSSRPLVLPEIRLRNAQIDYSEIRDGQYRAQGSIQIEGRLWPGDTPHAYQFSFQSRGQVEGVGPVVKGRLSMTDGVLQASLSNFELSQDVLTMLPSPVRQWWEAHRLSGRVDVPHVSYALGRNGQRGNFHVEVALDGVSLMVQPREWLSRAENQRLDEFRAGSELLRRIGMNLSGDVDHFASIIEPAAVMLHDVTGLFVFTQDGVEVRELTGRVTPEGVEGGEPAGQVHSNRLRITGRIAGYSPDAPANLRITSVEPKHIYIPPSPRFVRSLPREIRELYRHLRPEGTCSLWVEAERASAGAKPTIRGEVTVLDGRFVLDHFPYPLRDVTGRITFGPDPQTGRDRCDIVQLRGLGIHGGPNENVVVRISGFVAPLGDGAEVKVRVEGDGLVNEPALDQAFPADVRRVLRMFDPNGDGTGLAYRGRFVCDVHRPRGYRTRWSVGVRIMLEEASGAFEVFPYPLRQVRGELEIGPGVVKIRQVSARNGEASLTIDGQVRFGRDVPITPDLKISARNVPVDEDFLGAMPPQQRQWIQRIGLQGMMDFDGRVYREGGLASAIQYDFEMAVRDGAIFNDGDAHALTDLTGRARLTRQELALHDLRARRGASVVSADGVLAGLDGRPRLKLLSKATSLELDESLFKLLPAGAQRAWEQVQPWGTVDVEMRLDQAFGSEPGAQATQPSLAEVVTPPATTQPAHAPASTPATELALGEVDGTAEVAPAFEVVLTPVEMSVIPRAVPYQLDKLSGKIVIRPDRVELVDMAAAHGEAKIRLSGTGVTGEKSEWDLILSADRAVIDEDFRVAVPASLRDLIDALKLSGNVSFTFDKLHYRTVHVPRPSAGTQASTTNPATDIAHDVEADVDWSGTVTLHDASMTTGVPLGGVNGQLQLAGSIRAGRLSEVTGTLDFPELTMAGREMRRLRAELAKPADQPVMQLGKIDGELAGGSLAGRVDIALPEEGPSAYAVNMVLRNADVRTLVGDVADAEIKGYLTASIALEGNWEDRTRRRGRGDVIVEGKEMYRIPVVLGLLQIANLSLPISKPFNEAKVHYSVDGSRVALESMELRSDLMTMQGSGSLDFDSGKVKMTFVTDNPNMLKVPFLTELLQGMRQELFQIHVNGTLQEPKVGAAVMNTFTTTIDEVFKGNDPEAGGRRQ